MKHYPASAHYSRRSGYGVLAFGLAAACLINVCPAAVPKKALPVAARHAEPKKTAEAEPPLSKSVFLDEPSLKDPFFPSSSRRVVTPRTSSAPVAAQPRNLVLKGLSGTHPNRYAIINNYTLTQGEKAQIRVEGKAVNVEVMEIRDRSVLLRCDGNTVMELQLRQK